MDVTMYFILYNTTAFMKRDNIDEIILRNKVKYFYWYFNIQFNDIYPIPAR